MASPISTKKNPYYDNRKNSTVYTPQSLCNWLFEIIRIDGNIRSGNIIDACVGTGNMIRPFMNYIDSQSCQYRFCSFGFDIDDNNISFGKNECYTFTKTNYLEWPMNDNKDDASKIINKWPLWKRKTITNNRLYKELKYNTDLVLMNPPFNNEGCLKGYDKIIDYETNKKTQIHYNKHCKNCEYINPYHKCMKGFLLKNKSGKALLPELFIKHTFDLFGHKTPLVCISPMGLFHNQRMKSDRYKTFRDEYNDAQLTSYIPLPLDIFKNVEFHVGIYIWNILGMKPFYHIPDYVIDNILNEREGEIKL